VIHVKWSAICDLTIHYSDIFIDVRGSGEPIYVITSVIPKKGNNTHHLQRHTFHASPTQRLKNILRYHPNHRYFGRQLRILNNSFINLEKRREKAHHFQTLQTITHLPSVTPTHSSTSSAGSK